MNEERIYAGTVDEMKEGSPKVIKGGNHGIAVIADNDAFYAVDNRCPHLGFPLHLGSVCDGLLTCHWHHARFDIKTGGTLDPWADDVPAYPVEVIGNEVWVVTVPKNKQTVTSLRNRLREGLEQNLSLVIAKAVVGLVEAREPLADIAKVGVEFGTRHRFKGWRSGLTILTAMTNMLPYLDKNGQILALYQGLAHVARESAGMGTRFLTGPLPVGGDEDIPSLQTLSNWYRHSIEVRDVQGAERVLLTAIESGASNEELSDMMLRSVTDHYYMNTGHTLDFHNKAFEILGRIGSNNRDFVLTSLLPELSDASRSEEQNSWQTPVQLVTPLEAVFEEVMNTAFGEDEIKTDRMQLVELILDDQPLETIRALFDELKSGTSPVKLGQLVSAAAAERLARFHVQNEFRDWITVLHTFTHAHAVHESLKRSVTPELTRAIFHTAMSIYLDRFLNTPSARRPERTRGDNNTPPETDEFLTLLDKQQQTDQAAKWAADYLNRGGKKKALFNALGHGVLREDAEFHTFQVFEAAITEHESWENDESDFAEWAKDTMVFAAVRYIAAHAPTSREISHTAKIAVRLSRGEKLFEE
ncbi:Rieske 2Fe-2S domain-containing protein [Bacillus sp. H-16]|uniref:Rieske (2Fe-2S) protein n=1 Tax=Alteribacter salitolerans TaxID=2912333 RepID=UPI001966B30D|nr:Rieske 2Fe-2S domain-containing protein [Alteribacter salitolerans]MBM7094446.1 Rieske 2Fe-2S domain-containing protein [Alteribacter salitolerans]